MTLEVAMSNGEHISLKSIENSKAEIPMDIVRISYRETHNPWIYAETPDGRKVVINTYQICAIRDVSDVRRSIP